MYQNYINGARVAQYQQLARQQAAAANALQQEPQDAVPQSAAAPRTGLRRYLAAARLLFSRPAAARH